MFSFKKWTQGVSWLFFREKLLIIFFFSNYRLHIPKKWTKRRSSLHRNIRKWWDFRFIKNSWKALQIYSWTRRSYQRLGWGCTTNVGRTKSKTYLLTRLCLWKSWTSRCYSTKCNSYIRCWTYQSRIEMISSLICLFPIT